MNRSAEHRSVLRSVSEARFVSLGRSLSLSQLGSDGPTALISPSDQGSWSDRSRLSERPSKALRASEQGWKPEGTRFRLEPRSRGKNDTPVVLSGHAARPGSVCGSLGTRRNREQRSAGLLGVGGSVKLRPRVTLRQKKSRRGLRLLRLSFFRGGDDARQQRTEIFSRATY